MREWRGVIIQLANLAAIVYLATHAGSDELARYALGALGATNALSHMRARGEAALSFMGGGGGSGYSVPPGSMGSRQVVERIEIPRSPSLSPQGPQGPITPSPDTTPDGPKAKQRAAQILERQAWICSILVSGGTLAWVLLKSRGVL